MTNFSVRISTVVLLLLPLLMVFYYGLFVLGLDEHILFLKIKGMLLGKFFQFLVSRLGWCTGGLILAVILPLFNPIDMLAKHMVPSGSSGRALFDLNLPPADEPEPAVDQGPIPLSQAEEKILFRLTRAAPPRDMQRLTEEARAIAQRKGQIVDRMVELDRQAPDFWLQHRDAIISDSILTNRQTEYGSYKLSQMVEELTQGGADASPTFSNLCRIRKKFSRFGTFFC